MPDVLTKEQRSKNMKAIRSTNTEIERILCKALWAQGYRYRKNYKRVPGTPDIALVKYRIAIFCDSEFFHGKDWSKLKKKLHNSNNGEFWVNKIQSNRDRDKRVNKELEAAGWTILRFWGEDIKNETNKCVQKIIQAITSS